MSTKRSRDVGSGDDVAALAAPLRRLIAARVAEADVVDDLVQESLARVWEARWRLERSALAAYGIVTARNLVTSRVRDLEVERRNAARLVEPADVPAADEAALAHEEYAALAAALGRLPQDERDLLVDHAVEDIGTGKLAAERGTSPEAIGARLHRARARLRVEHVLEFRRMHLPTPRCRPVLMAISLGDRRRQRALRAGDHLLHCRACGEVAPPLLHRRRALTGLVPLAGLAGGWDRLRAQVQGSPSQAAVAGAATVAAVATAAVVVVGGGEPAARSAPAAAGSPAASPAGSPAAAPVASPAGSPGGGRATATALMRSGTLVAGGVTVVPLVAGTRLSRHVGAPATGTAVLVDSVPADEGFWVGSGPGRRQWVQIRAGGESPAQVRAGQRVSLRGRVVALPAGFARRVGLSDTEGARELAAQGAYVEVSPGALVVK